MGLWARWLGGDRRERARRRAARLLQRGDPAGALAELASLPEDDEAAASLRERARATLRAWNLDEAEALANAGEVARAREHLELARSFGGGEVDDRFRAVARAVRAATRPPHPRRGLALAGDPEVLRAGDRIALPEDDPRARALRSLDAWPEDLRSRLVALPDEVLAAMAAIDDGRPEDALAVLDRHLAEEPALRFERARAAWAAGRLGRAASDLATFAELFGHRVIGGMHTAILLARVRVEDGQPRAALEAIEAALEEEPDRLDLAGARATLLETLGRHEEARAQALEVLRRDNRDMALVRLLARCELRAGRRDEARRLLQRAIERNCATGRCGSRPLDLEAARMLATILLEDGAADGPVVELLARIRAAAPRPAWVDRFLLALQARNRGDPDAAARAHELLAGLEPGDPRRARVLAAFPGLAGEREDAPPYP